MSALVLSGLWTAAPAAELVVRLDGVVSDEGSLTFGLFDSAAGFAARRDGMVAQRTVAAAADGVVVRFDGLTDGHYAVTAYHDANDNDRLDRLFGLVPLEGLALSNNPELTRRPEFTDIAVVVAGCTEVTLRLVYLRDG